MITGVTSVDDYIAAHRLHYQRTRNVMLGIFGVAFFGGLLEDVIGPKASWITTGAVIGLIWQACYWYVDLPSRVRDLYAQYSGITDPITITWDSEYMHASTENAHAKRRWGDYVRVRENDAVFLLYITDGFWTVFPKHWFTSPEQLAEFRELAKQAGTATSPK